MGSQKTAKQNSTKNIDPSFDVKKVADLETKLRILTDQIAEERCHVNKKL